MNAVPSFDAVHASKDATTPAGQADYWAAFYANARSNVPVYPSQFAAFAINEFGNVDGVIEFGCGNGRDSVFFAGNGIPLLALDASNEAISLCQQRNAHAHARYATCKASEAHKQVREFLQGKPRVAVYARFFLHTIEEAEQRAFLGLLGELLPTGSRVFLEYRTTDDADQQKAFGTGHFRRYLDHLDALTAIRHAGFSLDYEIEGRGLAKYKNEDARVGRCVATRL